MNSIFHRTSVRSFKDEPVKPEDIELLMKAAMAAPSAGNQQPWEFCVVKDKALIQALSTASKYSGCAAKAPLVIVPCCKTEGLMFPEYREIDLSNACENLLLEADYLGYGAVWLGIAPMEDRMAKVKEILQLPDTLQPFALIPVGVPQTVRPQEDRYDSSRVHTYGE